MKFKNVITLGTCSFFCFSILSVNADDSVQSTDPNRVGRFSCSHCSPSPPTRVRSIRGDDNNNNSIKAVVASGEPRFFKRSGRGWTDEEEDRLLELTEQRRMPFAEIQQKFFPERTENALRTKHNQLTHDFYKDEREQKKWTEEQKRLLIKLVESNTPWSETAWFFPGRSVDALRGMYRSAKGDRFVPKRIIREWTTEENELLLRLAEEGIPWKKRVAFFDNRTLEAMQRQYTKVRTGPKPKPKPGIYTSEEDNLIVESLESGLTVIEIANLIGRKPRGVLKRIERLEQESRLKFTPPQIKTNRNYSVADFELMDDLRNRGLSWEEIAFEHFPGRKSENVMQAYARRRRKIERERREEEEEEDK